MRFKNIILLFPALLLSFRTTASVPPSDSLVTEFDNEYLDTVVLKTDKSINNYSMIGVNYGVTLTSMTFNPSHQQLLTLHPNCISLMYVHHEKMFDYIPYFAFKVGVEFSKEGYEFKPDVDTGETFEFYLEKSRKMEMDVIGVPMMAQLHYDARNFKAFADLGVYGGYRLNVRRYGPNVEKEYETSFYPTDIRWDYGLEGGVGFGIVFDPFEFHISGHLRYGWANTFQPDTTYPAGSKYENLNRFYYRYATPFDIMISAGLYVHLTKRHGRTTADLKREAKEIVYGTDE